MTRLTLDNESEIFFYEQEFYVFSNFSSFQIVHGGHKFPTSEHMYHWKRFQLASSGGASDIAQRILKARSAHDAFKMAQEYKHLQYENWDLVKVAEMKKILKLKVEQHDYVKQKLLESKGRVLIENSWRDSVWGWGPDRDGQNLLGKLWMEIRQEIMKDK